MKFCLLAMIFLSLALTTRAQAYESTIQYEKKKQAAIAIDVAYPPEAVENAFIQRMEKLGYKPKIEKGILNRDKGFLVFKNAYVTDISSDRMDYIVKVERKSRKESDEAVLYLVISRGSENAINKMDAFDIGSAKSYINNMLPDIEAANLELQIKAQEEIVAKAEKRLKTLQDDKIDLENKLAANVKEQEDTRKEIETQKQNLGVLQGKRREN